jgi:mannose-6-phosphate isomerase-like protein (cupin superfamily)
MLVMTERGADKLLASQFTLGAEGSAAAGPVGRTVTAQTDAQMHADILSWSRSQGLFAGVALEGATLREDLDDNATLYGKKLENSEIVTKRASTHGCREIARAAESVLRPGDARTSRTWRHESARRVCDKGVVMKGFVQDIEDLAVKNDEFRRVLYTAKHCQLVVMALKPKEEIGAEVHTLDQFFRVEAGTGEAILDGVRTAIRAGFAVVVPAGATHNIINTGTSPLKLYTLYAPPNHRDGVVHHTRDDAEADSEHFDGKTTE